MTATYQKFKYGSIEKEFDLSSSSTDAQFILEDEVLRAFEIQSADSYQVSGQILPLIRDAHGDMCPPRRIPCRHGDVIEVMREATPPGTTVLSSPTAQSGMSTPQSRLKSLEEVVMLADQPAQTLSAETTQDVIANHLAYTINAQSPEQKVDLVLQDKDGLRQQENVLEQLAPKILAMKQQAFDRLSLIQRKTDAILMQQLEITEFPIPRLFIVLPEEPKEYDPGNWFHTKFRLYFICEGGKHTEAAGSKERHHLHLAKHEGYVVREPTTFFKTYGPFLLVMLEMIKQGSEILAAPLATNHESVMLAGKDGAIPSAEAFRFMIDYALECIHAHLPMLEVPSPHKFANTESQGKGTQQDLEAYLKNVKGLEGVELRQLRSFLRTSSSDNLLGNLYRMMTSEGHVKWVCLDHYHASYQEIQVSKLRKVVSLAKGQFDEQMGKIKIHLASSVVAVGFYDALSNAKGVLELDVILNWKCRKSDVKALEKALRNTRISVLRLDVPQFQTSLGNQILPVSSRFGVFLRFRDLFHMKAVEIVVHPNIRGILSVQSDVKFRHCRFSFAWDAYPVSKQEFGTLAKAVENNLALTRLNLNWSSIGEKGVRSLSKALKRNSTLTTLHLGNNEIGENGARSLSKALKTNSTLTTLNLYRGYIKDNGACLLSEVLKTNSTLTTLNLGRNLIEENGACALSEALKTNSTLTTLSLEYNYISEEEPGSLSEALKTNSTLTALNLGINSIRCKGACSLSEALKTNSTLTSLNLEMNLFGDGGACALSEALKANSTLTTLNLRYTSIGEKGACALSEALKTNSALTTLILGWNSIGESGARSLSEALKVNSTLTTLDLWGNAIGDNGVHSLSEALRTNSTLTKLNLGHNSISEGGVQALSEALGTNSTLTYLNLHSNSIGDNGACALAEVLKTNSILTALDLAYNLIGENGARTMSEALQINSTLTILHLAHNRIGKSGIEALSKARTSCSIDHTPQKK